MQDLLIRETEKVASDTVPPEINHIYCTDCYIEPGKEYAYCGIFVGNDEDNYDYDLIDCVVCIGLDVCPKCGKY